MTPNNNNQNNEEKDNLDFTFSDIPILGKGTKGKRNSFSFEEFNPNELSNTSDVSPSEEEEHLALFTQMLEEVEENNENTDEEFSGLSGTQTNILSPEELEQQKGKWEDATQKKLKKKKILKITIPALIVFILAGTLLFLFNPFASAPPVPVKPVSPKPVIPPKPVVPTKKDKKEKNAPQKEKGKPENKGTGKSIPLPLPDTTKTEGKIEPKENETAETSEIDLEARKKRHEKREQQDLLKKLNELLAKEKNAPQKEKGILAKEFPEIMAKYPKDVEFQVELHKELMEAGYVKYALKIYNKKLTENPNSPLDNFLYARTLGNIPVAKEYLKKAVAKSPALLSDAFYSLGIISYKKREWEKASQYFSDYLKYHSENQTAMEKLAVSTLRAGNISTALKKYQEYLQLMGLSKGKIAVYLLKIAQLTPSPVYSQKYLEMLKKDPKMSSEYKIYAIKHKAIYGKLHESDFDDTFIISKQIRQERMLFLLSKGRDMEVAMMPTPPEDFPDFWKIFLGWRKNDNNWKDNAEKLVEKYRNKDDKTYSVIVSVWLGNLKADEARNMKLNTSVEKEPLLFFALAEYFKKKKSFMKTKVLYRKALKQSPNPYKNVIEFYQKK